jgi:hypothetical protein
LSQTDRSANLTADGGGLGLNCSSDGLSLAGVPLLRITLVGLAPRSASDLAELMHSAYGHDVDLVKLSSGLDVVAKALNSGDVGRAMIAASHLRLSELNWNSAARLARAEEMLKGFNPLESRDWRGWWTTGGGAKPNSSTKPSPVPAGSSRRLIPRRPSGSGAAPPVRSVRMPATSFGPSPMSIAGRLAIGEEVVGGGPENPFADAAALATLGIGALMATNRQPGAGRRGRPRSSQIGAIPLGPDDDECEEQLTRDRINCQIVNATRGYQKGAVCRSVAMERYSECRTGGLGNVRTPPYWGN